MLFPIWSPAMRRVSLLAGLKSHWHTKLSTDVGNNPNDERDRVGTISSLLDHFAFQPRSFSPKMRRGGCRQNHQAPQPLRAGRNNRKMLG